MKKLAFFTYAWMKPGGENWGENAIVYVLKRLFKELGFEIIHSPIEADIVVCGGGTLFFTLNRTNWTEDRILKLKAPFILLGVGIADDERREGEIRTAKSMNRLKEICNKAKYVAVRDNASKEILERCGARDIEVSGDPTVMLSELVTMNKQLEDNAIIINVIKDMRNVMTFYNKRNEDHVVEVVNRLIEKYPTYNWYKTLFNNRDNPAYKQVKATKLDYLSPIEMTSTIRGTKFGICERMHSAILSASLHIPFITLEYCEILTKYLDDISFMKPYALRSDTLTLEDLEKAFNKLEKDSTHYLRNKLIAWHSDMRNRFMKHLHEGAALL